jgi:hypothetical protein
MDECFIQPVVRCSPLRGTPCIWGAGEAGRTWRRKDFDLFAFDLVRIVIVDFSIGVESLKRFECLQKSSKVRDLGRRPSQRLIDFGRHNMFVR